MTAQSSGTQVCAPLLIYMVAGSYWCPSLLAGGLRVDPRAQEPGIAVTMTDAFKQSGCYPAMAWGAAKDKRSEGLVHGLKAVHHSRSTRGLQPHGTSWAAGLHCRNSSRGAGCDRPRQVRWCAAGIGTLGSELARLKRMQRRRGGALALLRTSTIRPKTRGRAAGRLSRARPVQDRAGGEGGPHEVVRGEVGRLGEGG